MGVLQRYIVLSRNKEITWVGTKKELLELKEDEYINTQRITKV